MATSTASRRVLRSSWCGCASYFRRDSSRATTVATRGRLSPSCGGGGGGGAGSNRGLALKVEPLKYGEPWEGPRLRQQRQQQRGPKQSKHQRKRGGAHSNERATQEGEEPELVGRGIKGRGEGEGALRVLPTASPNVWTIAGVVDPVSALHRPVAHEESSSKAKAHFYAPKAFNYKLPPWGQAEVAFAGRSNVGKSTLVGTLLSNQSLVRTSKKPGCTTTINYYGLVSGHGDDTRPLKVKKSISRDGKGSGSSGSSGSSSPERKVFSSAGTIQTGLIHGSNWPIQPDPRTARCFFVDLPGYGFARRGKGQIDEWMENMAGFFSTSRQAVLRRTFLLVDARHGIKPQDRDTMYGLDELGVAYQLVLTKADKLSPLELQQTLLSVAQEIDSPGAHAACFPVIHTVSAHRGWGLSELWNTIDYVVTADVRGVLENEHMHEMEQQLLEQQEEAEEGEEEEEEQ